MKKILVIGSISIDNVTYTSTKAKPGMTVYGDSFISNVGGKGANQACGIFFLGGDVNFYGAVGNDNNGKTVQNYLKQLQIPAFLKISEESTGVANIVIDNKTAENSIIIVPGANLDLNIEDIDKISFDEYDILLLQLENKIDTVVHSMRQAKEKGLLVVLNPAPFQPIPNDALKYIDFFIPNEHELEQFTSNIDGDYLTRAQALVKKGIKQVIVTLGDKGSMYVDKEKSFNVDPYRVDAVDTTAAGDSFCGAFVTALSKGLSTKEAMDFASRASSITVTRKGAIQSLPHSQDLK